MALSSTSRSASAASPASLQRVQPAAPSPAYRVIPEQIGGFNELGLRRCSRTGAAPRTGARHRPDWERKSTTLPPIDKITTERRSTSSPSKIRWISIRTRLPGQPAKCTPTARLLTRCARCARTPDIVSPAMRDLETIGPRCASPRRPLCVRDAAHEPRGADDQPHHRRLPRASRANPRSCPQARGHRRQTLLPRADGAGRVVARDRDPDAGDQKPHPARQGPQISTMQAARRRWAWHEPEPGRALPAAHLARARWPRRRTDEPEQISAAAPASSPGGDEPAGRPTTVR